MSEVGKRVKLMFTSDPYTQLKRGDEGIITKIRTDHIGDEVVSIKWDSGSNLSLITAEGDMYEIIEEK